MVVIDPHTDSSFYMDVSNIVQTTVEDDGKKINKNNSSEIGIIQEFSTDSCGNTIVKITYDKIKISTEDEKGKEEYDAANGQNAGNQIETILANLKGSPIFLTLSPKGDILSGKGTTFLHLGMAAY